MRDVNIRSGAEESCIRIADFDEGSGFVHLFEQGANSTRVSPKLVRPHF
jgi:hypothetical protein